MSVIGGTEALVVSVHKAVAERGGYEGHVTVDVGVSKGVADLLFLVILMLTSAISLHLIAVLRVHLCALVVDSICR